MSDFWAWSNLRNPTWQSRELFEQVGILRGVDQQESLQVILGVLIPTDLRQHRHRHQPASGGRSLRVQPHRLLQRAIRLPERLAIDHVVALAATLSANKIPRCSIAL